MEGRSVRKLVLLALLLGWAVCAYADPVEFTFIAWSGGQWQNGYPYVIQPTGGEPDSILFVMCDDYVHGGFPGQQWEANITQLGSDNLDLARFNLEAGDDALSPLLRYDEAGWILLQTLVQQPNQYQGMNYAVWNLFDPSAPCNQDCEMWLSDAEMAAQHGFPNTDFNRVYIITPVDQHDPDPNSPQEFLALGTDSGLINLQNSPTVPEPGTLLLLGSGLVAILGGRKFLS